MKKLDNDETKKKIISITYQYMTEKGYKDGDPITKRKHNKMVRDIKSIVIAELEKLN